MKNMKKSMKKAFALLLTAVMILSLSVTAFAADTITITIENATIDETYTAYKIFDATVDGSGNIAYTYNGTLPENDFFTQDSVGNISATAAASDFDGKLTAGAVEFLGNLKTGSTPQVSGKADATPFVLDVSSTGYGYYYITSTLNGGKVVTVDSTNPNAKVIDKNQGPTWDNDPDPPDDDPAPGKVIVNADGSKTTVNSVNYGESVTFDIGVNATNYVGTEQVTYYYINDTISKGFTLDLDNGAFKPVVKVGNKTLTAGQDYTVSVDGNSFEIIINWANITVDEDGAITAIQSLYDANTEIHVRYTATVNADGKDVVIAGKGNPNTANFTWNTNKVGDEPDDPNDPPETPSEPYSTQKQKTTTTYVYALGVKKVDPKGNVLTGAQFSVAGIQASGSNGVYIYTGATEKGGTDTVMDTDTNGVLLIKGLKAATYTVKEEKSPLGYNLLTDTVDITAAIESTSTYTETITTYYDKDGNVIDTEVQGGSSTTTTVAENVVPLVVVNQAGTELPSTGGIGTTIFYILGSLMVVAAGVVLVSRKRMSAKG